MTERAEECECHLCNPSKVAQAAGAKQQRKRKCRPINRHKVSDDSAGRTKLEIQIARGEIPPNGIVSQAHVSQPRVPQALPRVSLPELDPKYPSDEEGPDYWKILLMKLKAQGTIDEQVQQRLNIDWALTHEALADSFTRLTLQASYIPRRGEVVLWTPILEGTLEFNHQEQCVMIKGEDDTWKGLPDWRAGVVAQTPEEQCNFMDIVQLTTKKENNVTSYGFRVETLPDPLEDDKSYSLHDKYVPLKNIRPFAAFNSFLSPVARENMHPSIEFAMTTMASWSLLNFQRFQGTWPNAKLYAQGIWIGHELLVVKDAVRLKPVGLTPENMKMESSKHTDEIPVKDVMVIEKIWLEMNNCTDDPGNPEYAESYEVLIAGKVYTLDKDRLEHPCPFGNDPLTKLNDREVDGAFQYVGMHGYGDWYRVANGRTCVVSKSMILGRIYEPEANYLYFRTFDLGYDLEGVLSGRHYSTQVDNRIAEGTDWFWGDFRVETLGLATVNGIDCGVAAEQRDDMPRWQAMLRILHDCPKARDMRVAFEDPDELDTKGPGGRPLNLAFAALGKTSSLVSSGLGQAPRDSSKEESDTGPLNTEASEVEVFDEVIPPLPSRPEEEEDYMDDGSDRADETSS